MKMNKYGFTLAEVLITLSIIGVIASMVIPSLVQDLQDAQLKTAWKKTYADLDGATKRILLENAGSLKGVFTDNISIINNFSKYLNYVKQCNTNASSNGCWHLTNNWKALDGTRRDSVSESGLVLNNGTLLRFVFQSQNCSESSAGISRCGSINVDINGFKGPNTIGKDIFGCEIRDKSLMASGSLNQNVGCEGSTGTGSGWGCSAKYLYK